MACASSAPRAAAAVGAQRRFQAFAEAPRHSTAAYRITGGAAAAHAYVDAQAPHHRQADGLAAGVVVAADAGCTGAIDFMLLDNRLGVSHNEGRRAW